VAKKKLVLNLRDLNVSFVRHYAHNAALLNKKSTKLPIFLEIPNRTKPQSGG
jgi:hypothetical protein